VPVTRLYDLGITVATSKLLQQRIGTASIVLNAESASQLGLDAGDQVELSGTRIGVRVDATVPANVVLVPRSMGLPVESPFVAKLKKA